MAKHKILFFGIIFFVSSQLLGQDKFEKESRLSPNKVPSKALSFIDSLNFDTKVKWYKEEGIHKTSIEAKFKLNKVAYSVEFDSLGHIEDVEINVKWNDLPPNIRDTISLQLAQNCLSHKIVKVQKQFTGTEETFLSHVKSENTLNLLTTKYELIVRCKQQKAVELFEYLFDETGKIRSTSKIVFKNSSHLEY